MKSYSILIKNLENGLSGKRIHILAESVEKMRIKLADEIAEFALEMGITKRFVKHTIISIDDTK